MSKWQSKETERWKHLTELLIKEQKTESQNHLTWSSLSSTLDWSTPCQLDHCTKCCVQLLLEAFQGWWLQHFPGQWIILSMKKTPIDVKPEFPLPQLEAVSSFLVYSCLWEKAKSLLATISFWGIVESDMVTSELFPRPNNPAPLSTPHRIYALNPLQFSSTLMSFCEWEVKN